MRKFKVGDRVIVNGSSVTKKFDNAIGTVLDVDSNGILGVKFDKDIGGHHLGGLCKLGYGWWLNSSSGNIKHYHDKDKIIIYRSGNKVVAKDCKTNKECISRCHPDDEFDFNVGAKLAFDRLVGNVESKPEPKPKYYNGKVVCVDSFTELTTKGKIYEFVDGYLTYDTGDKSCDAVHSFEDICKSFMSKFIEVVE